MGLADVTWPIIRWTLTGNILSLKFLQRAGETLALALVYYALARIGLQLQFAQSQASPVWAPSGMAFASVLLLGIRAGGGVFVGAFCANLADFYVKSGGSEYIEINGFVGHLANHPDHTLVSALIAAGNTLEATTGYYLLGRLAQTWSLPFSSIRDVLAFCAITPVMCAVSSTIGVASLVVIGALPATLFEPAWLTWWLGDITGILIVSPFIITWWHIGRFSFEATSVSASALSLVVLFLFSAMTFNEWFDVSLFRKAAYLLFPILLYVTFKHSIETATLGIFLTSMLAIFGTIHGRGPFVREDQNESLLLLQGFISVVSMTVLFLTAAVSERRRALEVALDARRRLMQAQENERLRLARELHDQTGQSLAAVMLELKEMEVFIIEGGRDRLQLVRRKLEQMGKSLHHVAWELRPASMDELGLESTLTNYVSEWRGQFGIEADFHCHNTKLDELADEVRTTIYRVIQEALTNIAKHAHGATFASIVIDQTNTMLQLIIEDNGVGFDVRLSTEAQQNRRGLGLIGMRERLALVGGEFDVESSAGAGTTVFARIRLPIARTAA